MGPPVFQVQFWTHADSSRTLGMHPWIFKPCHIKPCSHVCNCHTFHPQMLYVWNTHPNRHTYVWLVFMVKWRQIIYPSYMQHLGSISDEYFNLEHGSTQGSSLAFLRKMMSTRSSSPIRLQTYWTKTLYGYLCPQPRIKHVHSLERKEQSDARHSQTTGCETQKKKLYCTLNV